MPFFKKKKKIKIPDAPGFTYPEVEEMKKTIKTLPQENYDLPELPELPELADTAESEKYERPTGKKLPTKLTQEVNVARKKGVSKVKEKGKRRIIGVPRSNVRIGPRSIFIKITKFKEILSSIEVVEKRIHEIETIIKKLKEIRLREDQQMTSWEQEIEELKERLDAMQKLISQIE